MTQNTELRNDLCALIRSMGRQRRKSGCPWSGFRQSISRVTSAGECIPQDALLVVVSVVPLAMSLFTRALLATSIDCPRSHHPHIRREPLQDTKTALLKTFMMVLLCCTVVLTIYRYNISLYFPTGRATSFGLCLVRGFFILGGDSQLFSTLPSTEPCDATGVQVGNHFIPVGERPRRLHRMCMWSASPPGSG